MRDFLENPGMSLDIYLFEVFPRPSSLTVISDHTRILLGIYRCFSW